MKLNLGGQLRASRALGRCPTGICHSIRTTALVLDQRRRARVPPQKSYNASFSAEVCFRLCVKASGFTSKGSGFSQLDFEDIDGDGKVDHVLKLDDDREVYAKLNRLRKTELLKRVTRPLGGSFDLALRSAKATR